MEKSRFAGIFALTVLIVSAGCGVSAFSGPTNLVVDFDLTSFDSSLSPGDSGVLNLVVRNAGGYRADNVEVYIPSTGIVDADRRVYLGRIESGASKTIPMVVRVRGDAGTGLTAVNVRIGFDGFDGMGNAERNMLNTWNIPLRVYGRPLFQLHPVETTYYVDSMGRLVFEGTLLSPVRDLEATLSSSCLTVIGSSKNYLGNTAVNRALEIAYDIKPSEAGACIASLLLEYTDESGNSAANEVSFGLNIEGAGVDFKVLNITQDKTGPGDKSRITVGLKNVGKASSDDTAASLTLSAPFVPVDTNEKFIGTVGPGETVFVDFDVSVGWDASIQAYTIPLSVDYKVGGTSYSVGKNIGFDVAGTVILEVIEVSNTRNLQIVVANIGSRLSLIHISEPTRPY